MRTEPPSEGGEGEEIVRASHGISQETLSPVRGEGLAPEPNIVSRAASLSFNPGVVSQMYLGPLAPLYHASSRV